MDPHLFEVECKKRIEEMNGKLTCWKCPEGTGHTFVQFTKLKTHLRQHHTEWIELSAKIQDQNKFICPGVCGASKQFDSEDKARNHCLSKDCGDQAGFLMLKARHDQIQVERYNMQKKYKRAVSAQGRAAMYVNQVKYFAALDEEDLLELADQHDIPREEITPHIPAMLENFHHAAETVLSAAGQN